jgi:hypothetical protein
VLGQLDLLAPEGGQGQVGNPIRKLIRGHSFSLDFSGFSAERVA